MKTIDEQYKIQYNEIKTYWKKKRKKRALIFFILTIISSIATIFFRNTEYFPLLKYGLLLIIVACVTCTCRELIIPMNEETKEIKQLNKIYNEQRFKERNG